MIAKLRIFSGIVLFLFVLGHLINIGFGLISLQAMEDARPILMGLWSNPIGGPILLIAFVTHGALGLVSLYKRNTLLTNFKDSGQAFLGLAILPLLLPHIMGTAVGPALTGASPSFTWVLAVYWLFAPALGMQQVLALVVIWAHGCYGMFLWLGVQSWWVRVAPLAYPLVVAIPTAALLGFVSAGKFLFANRQNDEVMAPMRETARLYDTVGGRLWELHDQILIVYLGIVAAVLWARYWRLRGSKPFVDVAYDNARPFSLESGETLLEMAAREHIQHASLCGGRGRCGSCAVRLLEGSENLAPIQPMEAQTLEQRSLGPGIRLACQAMPQGGPIHVERVYDPRILPSEYQALIKARRAQAGQSQLPEDQIETLAVEVKA